MNRRLVLPLLALLLLAPLMTGFGPVKQQSGNIALTLDAGFGGRFREQQWTPLRLTVQNDGPDVRGVLRVRGEGNSGLSNTTYRTAIDLPRQSRKQIFLYVAPQSFARQITVELVADDGTILTTADALLTPASTLDLLTAVITDSPGGSVDLTGIALGGGQTYQINWPVEQLPATADALQALDVIVLTDVDTGRLSLDQKDALLDWTLTGGHLIVTGGPNYRLTTAALLDVLPVEISGSTTLDDLTPLATYAGRRSDSLAEPDVIIATGSLRPDAQILVEAGSYPLLARRIHGEGLIDYLAADPGLAPFRRWDGSGELWKAVTVITRQQPSWSDGFTDWFAANRVVQNAPGFDLPTALQLCGLMLVYIVMVGPLNYLVLRVLRRRELAWLTIPVLVVIFSVITYFTGFNLRGTQVTLNRVSVVQVWPGEDHAQVDGLIGVLSPRRSTYHLAVPQGLTLRPMPEGNQGGFNPVGLATVIEQSTVFSAPELLVDSSYVRGFATTGIIENAPQVSAELTLGYRADAGVRLAGSLSNTTDFILEDAVVLVQGGAQYVGTLLPGDSAAIDLPLSGSQSAPLTLINRPETGLTYNMQPFTVQDAMGPDFNPYRIYNTYGSSASVRRERVLIQRHDLLTALTPDLDFSGGRGDRAFLAGWATDSPLDVSLGKASWVPEDLTLYIFELPLEIQREGARHTIPAGLSTWTTTEHANAASATPYGLTITGGEQAAFQFAPLPSAQLDRVEQLEVTTRRTSADSATIYLWNWTQENWEKVSFTQGARATLENPAPFVGPGNAVEVLIVPDNINGMVSYAQVDVSWQGTF